MSLALYNPLNYSFAQIRLLELLPGCNEDQIRCRLHAPVFLDGGGYEALSYVWGDPINEMKDILVDDTMIRITSNLAMALHYIREQGKSRYLWVDAVCINQNDNREKNHQVKLMSDIYSRADKVLVFLGLEDGCSEAFDYFDAVSKARDNDSPLPTNNSSKLLLAFWNLLSKPWWSRVWVIQEFVLATKEPLIGCGRRWTTVSALSAGLVALPEAIDFQNPLLALELHDISMVSIMRLIQSRIGLLSHVALKTGADLSTLVTISQFHDSTEQRDKIFALNSLMMEPFRTVLAPDYSLSLRTVYTEMTTLLLCIRRWGKLYEFFQSMQIKDYRHGFPIIHSIAQK